MPTSQPQGHCYDPANSHLSCWYADDPAKTRGTSHLAPLYTLAAPPVGPAIAEGSRPTSGPWTPLTLACNSSLHHPSPPPPLPAPCRRGSLLVFVAAGFALAPSTPCAAASRMCPTVDSKPCTTLVKARAMVRRSGPLNPKKVSRIRPGHTVRQEALVFLIYVFDTQDQQPRVHCMLKCQGCTRWDRTC